MGTSPRPKAGQQAEAPQGTSGPTSGQRQTSEPQPGLGIEAETTSLQKNLRGGVATVLLKISAAAPIEDAVVSARTSSKVVFADGSTARSWNIDLKSGGTVAIPAEVIVPVDGKYALAVEVTGTTGGKSVRRALSHKIYVGVKEPRKKSRDGAIEYPAIEVPPAPEDSTQPSEPPQAAQR